MSDEMKIVIVTKGNAGSIGVQSPDCDPVFVMVDGGLEAILANVPEVVAAAKQKWQASPKNPKCETPLPSQEKPAAKPAATTTGARPAPQPAAAKPQQKFF